MDFSRCYRSIQAESSQAGTVFLGLCLHRPSQALGAELGGSPRPCPSRSPGELGHQLPGESSGSDSPSRQRHGPRQQNGEAAAVTSARSSVRVSQEDAPGESTALTAPPRPRWRILLSTHSALGCPWPPSLLWGFHAAVTAASGSHLPWDPPSLAPLALPGLPSVPSPFPSFRVILFSTALFSTLSLLLKKKKNPLSTAIKLCSSLCLSGTPASFYPFGFYNTDISLLMLVYFFSAFLFPPCRFPVDCCSVLL